MPLKREDEPYWVIVNDPKLPPKELAKHHKDLSTAETKLYAKVYAALDGAEIIVKKRPDGTYALWDWLEADDAKIKEAFYAVEQDPVFGAFCNDRERFDEAWEAGWAIQTIITLAKEFFEII